MKSIMAGPHGQAIPGDILTVDDATGKALVSGGYAAAIGAPETSAIMAPEKAVLPKPVRKKGR